MDNKKQVSFMEFISFAPCAYSYAGHDVIYQTCLYETCKKLNVSFLLLLSAKSPIKDLPFEHNHSLHLSPLHKIFSYLNVFRKSKGNTIYFLESFRMIDLMAAMLGSLFMKKEDVFFLFFRRSSRKLFIAVRFFRKNTIFLTDSEIVAAQFYEKTKTKIHVMPIPHTSVMCTSDVREKIVCYWPGEPRKSKGLLEMEWVSSLADQRFELVAAEASGLKNAKWIKNVLSREEYLKYLMEADLILLPYDPIVYREGSSGIFVEAVCLGKIPVVKEGSWLAYELKKFQLDDLIIQWEEADFFDRLESIFFSKNVREKLDVMREKYSAFHNQENFTQCIKGLIELHKKRRICPVDASAHHENQIQ
jgi:hypothetical protein